MYLSDVGRITFTDLYASIFTTADKAYPIFVIKMNRNRHLPAIPDHEYFHQSISEYQPDMRQNCSNCLEAV